MESEVKNSKCDEFKKCLMDRIGACWIRKELLRALYGKHFHIFKRNIKKELDRNEIELKVLESIRCVFNASIENLEGIEKYGKQAYLSYFDIFSEDKHGE